MSMKRTTTRKRTEKVRSAHQKRSVREALDNVEPLLEAVEADLADWVRARMGLIYDDGIEFDSAHVDCMVECLKDLRASLSDAAGPRAFREALNARREAVSAARDEVSRLLLEQTRPVEVAYRQVEQVLANGQGQAEVIVLPVLPKEVGNRMFDEWGSDYLEGDVPPKVAAMRQVLEQRNRNLSPAGWVGLATVPDFGIRGYDHLRKALAAFSERHKVVLLATPRTKKRKGDLVQNVVESVRNDRLQGVLANGQNPRVSHYIGDVVAREGFSAPDGEPLDEEIVIPPIYAVAGAIARNDYDKGVHEPPASVMLGAGGEIQVTRVLNEFTDRQWTEAHNADPQPLNVVYYHPEYQQAFVFGAHVAGGQVETLGSQRIIDKLSVLATKLLTENLGQANVSDPKRKRDLEKAALQILKEQRRMNALKDDGKNQVEVKKIGEGAWSVRFLVDPSTLDTAFQFEVIKTKDDES